jgi:hypothetical protein
VALRPATRNININMAPVLYCTSRQQTTFSSKAFLVSCHANKHIASIPMIHSFVLHLARENLTSNLSTPMRRYCMVAYCTVLYVGRLYSTNCRTRTHPLWTTLLTTPCSHAPVTIWYVYPVQCTSESIIDPGHKYGHSASHFRPTSFLLHIALLL